jgi:hypothetical protein
MPNIRRIAVALDVAGPLELGCVGMSSSNVSGLELLQLLLRAEFVCLYVG